MKRQIAALCFALAVADFAWRRHHGNICVKDGGVEVRESFRWARRFAAQECGDRGGRWKDQGCGATAPSGVDVIDLSRSTCLPD